MHEVRHVELVQLAYFGWCDIILLTEVQYFMCEGIIYIAQEYDILSSAKHLIALLSLIPLHTLEIPWKYQNVISI